MRRSAEADALWSDMYHAIAEQDLPGIVGSITARAEAHLLRLSMVYALLDGTGIVEERHLRAAWAVWCYADESAAYIFGDAGGDPLADRILAELRKHPDVGLSNTDLSALFHRHARADELERARVSLVDRGLAETVAQKTNGRSRLVTFLCERSESSAESNGNGRAASLSSLLSQRLNKEKTHDH
jgi:hypothetical protein